MTKEISTFADLKLNTWLIKQCDIMGLKSPTPIQKNCIPPILEGLDCIGCAKTGSGKTLTFVLPILQKLCEDPYGIFALVLTPTRELAIQIGDQFAVMGKPINLRKAVVVGGMDMVTQGLELSRKPHVVVATPGRLADHIESCMTFSLSSIKFLVLDEADTLLSGRFETQLKTIFSKFPKTRQNLIFSATITDTLEKVKQMIASKAFTWVSQDDSNIATVKELCQRYVLCPKDVLDSFLVQVIQKFRGVNESGSIMIFTDTCRNCQVISMMLNEIGFENVALHAMMKQKDRTAALSKFKSGHIKILIATDVASRGLDIPTVQLVINHSIPNVPKNFIHRVGRTARAGKGGIAISLITPHDIKLLKTIEDTIGIRLEEYKIDDKDVLTNLLQISLAKREAEIKLDEMNFDERKLINKRKKLLMEGKDIEEIEEILSNRKKHKKPEKRKKSQNESNTNEQIIVNRKEKFLVIEKDTKKINKVLSNEEKDKKPGKRKSLNETSKSLNGRKNIEETGEVLSNKKRRRKSE